MFQGLRRTAALALAAVLCVISISAHAAVAYGTRGNPFHSPSSAAPGAPVQTVTGVVDQVIVDNAVANTSTRYLALMLDDGRAFALKGAGVDSLVAGQRVQMTGSANGNAFFAYGWQALRVTPSAAAHTKSTAGNRVEGRLLLAHSDDFANGKSQYTLVVRADNGRATTLNFSIVPDVLEPGMRIAAEGNLSPIGTEMSVQRVVILALPEQKAATELKSVTSNNLLVILVKFTDSPSSDPFTQAQVQSTFITATSSVQAFYNEVSYGEHLLNPITVTPWVSAGHPAPATCDFNSIGTWADAAATAAGYAGSYNNRYYVFPRLGVCGWAGLAYVGFGEAWSNGYNLVSVYGHELGHNFGLLHAASLRCTGQPIGGACSASEYGDPFDIMGNVAAKHFNAAQKNQLGWIPPTSIAKQSSGTQSYAISPMETAGGTTYAVEVPAFLNRTYWVEYRTSTGFDSGTTAGAQIRVASPFETSCASCADDTELLDMTPGTSTFNDAPLTVGNMFVDNESGTTIQAVSTGTNVLNISIARPPTAMQFALYRPSANQFMVDWNFDHSPDLLIPFGAPGDVPRVGRFAGDGSDGFAVYRNGTWYIDKNRNGTADITVGFGGAAGDIPLVGNPFGDSTDSLVVYRSGTWFVDRYLNGTVDAIYFFGGLPGDIPLMGDVNGDGKDDLVIYRSGTWYISTGRNGVADIVAHFGGLPGDIPALFDWNGDGKADLCIYRNGLWYVNTTLDGSLQALFGYGAAGDVPLPGIFR